MIVPWSVWEGFVLFSGSCSVVSGFLDRKTPKTKALCNPVGFMFGLAEMDYLHTRDLNEHR